MINVINRINGDEDLDILYMNIYMRITFRILPVLAWNFESAEISGIKLLSIRAFLLN